MKNASVMAISIIVLSFALCEMTNARMSNERKCSIYKDIWSSILSKSDTSKLSPSFVDSHNAFVQTGCVDYNGVCPRSEYDVSIANQLTIAAMNNGMASTFLPFKCSNP